MVINKTKMIEVKKDSIRNFFHLFIKKINRIADNIKLKNATLSPDRNINTSINTKIINNKKEIFLLFVYVSMAVAIKSGYNLDR
tara:strand:+ start:300 stop:551 length:252 start_codon:yes stop_codon:yes gene_type:complete